MYDTHIYDKNGTHNFIFIIFYVFFSSFICDCECMSVPNKFKSIDFICRLLYILYLKIHTKAPTHTHTHTAGNDTTNTLN